MPEVALQAEELGIPQNAGSRGGTRCFYLAFKKLWHFSDMAWSGWVSALEGRANHAVPAVDVRK
jgi:hypothetical protein